MKFERMLVNISDVFAAVDAIVPKIPHYLQFRQWLKVSIYAGPVLNPGGILFGCKGKINLTALTDGNFAVSVEI